MISRTRFVLAVALMVAIAIAIPREGKATGAGKATTAESGIEVAIALPHSAFRSEIYVDLNSDAHFPVVITNTSASPINFVQEGNSWGDGALWFKATDEKGKTYEFRKKPCDWFDNGLTYWVLQPGEHLVIDVCFGAGRQGEDTWGGIPDVSQKGDTFKMTMTAVFDFDTAKADKVTLWTGHAESKPLDCRLRDIRKYNLRPVVGAGDSAGGTN